MLFHLSSTLAYGTLQNRLELMQAWLNSCKQQMCEELEKIDAEQDPLNLKLINNSIGFLNNKIKLINTILKHIDVNNLEICAHIEKIFDLYENNLEALYFDQGKGYVQLHYLESTDTLQEPNLFLKLELTKYHIWYYGFNVSSNYACIIENLFAQKPKLITNLEELNEFRETGAYLSFIDQLRQIARYSPYIYAIKNLLEAYDFIAAHKDHDTIDNHSKLLLLKLECHFFHCVYNDSANIEAFAEDLRRRFAELIRCYRNFHYKHYKDTIVLGNKNDLMEDELCESAEDILQTTTWLFKRKPKTAVKENRFILPLRLYSEITYFHTLFKESTVYKFEESLRGSEISGTFLNDSIDSLSVIQSRQSAPKSYSGLML